MTFIASGILTGFTALVAWFGLKKAQLVCNLCSQEPLVLRFSDRLSAYFHGD